MCRGGLDGAYRLPTFSSVGASPARLRVRLQTPLIKPDVRIARVRLSEKTQEIAIAIPRDAVCAFWKQTRSRLRLFANLPVLRRFFRPPSTEDPSLHRSYPASSALRASRPSRQSSVSFASCRLIHAAITAGTSRLRLVRFARMPSPIRRQV